MKRNCELCNGDASIYCPSDNAFLCYSCDTKVHCANFLVARHVRSFVCIHCSKLNGEHFSGAGAPPLSCRDCSHAAVVQNSGGGCDDDDDDSLSSSSSCVSSTGEAAEEAAETTSFRKRREKLGGVDVKRGKGTVVPDLKVEGVLVNWCKKMSGCGGSGVEERQIGAVVNTAVELLSGCLDEITSLPFRVSLAACFWVAIKVVRRRSGVHSSGGASSTSTCQDLRRVEQISGVPAKLILATEVKLARVIKRRQPRNDQEEGWAEC